MQLGTRWHSGGPTACLQGVPQAAMQVFDASSRCWLIFSVSYPQAAPSNPPAVAAAAAVAATPAAAATPSRMHLPIED